MDEQLDFGFEDQVIYQYLFMISPTYQIISDVKSMKRKINVRFPLPKKEMESIAHITLFELLDPHFTDTEIVETIQHVLKNFSRFTIKLNHTEFWKHGTFILKVKHPEMIKQIHAAFVRTGFKIKEKTMTPHLTIVKGLSQQQIAQIPQDPFIFDYEAEFECQAITVMKRWVKGNKQGTYELVSKVGF